MTGVMVCPREWDLRPLRQPPWWLALGLLLVNDNLLKGRGLLPGWLTGKLSDLAFLIVAPVLAFALLPARLPGRRPLVLLAITGVYGAADLWPPFSDWLVQQALAVGLRWRLWPDPSDLLALAVLPGAWWLMRPLPQAPLARTARLPSWSERLLAAAGGLACLATSAPPEYAQAPFLINRRSEPVAVRLSWTQQPVTCEGPLDTLAQELTPAAFGPAFTLDLEPAQVAALDAPPPAGESSVGRCHILDPPREGAPVPPVCTAVLLVVDGQPARLIRAARAWLTSNSAFLACTGSSQGEPSRCAPRLDSIVDPGEGALALEGSRRLVPFTGIEVTAYPHPF